MKDKIQTYCMYEYNNCLKRHSSDVEKAIDRCYGAVMFVLNYCTQYDDEIVDWWDSEMLPNFRTLQRGDN